MLVISNFDITRMVTPWIVQHKVYSCYYFNILDDVTQKNFKRIESAICYLVWFFTFKPTDFFFFFYSIAVGLEVIEEGTPLDSDSDVGHYLGSDSPDSRKFILQMQRLNSRVNELERNVQQNSVGFWSKMAFFAFTIINPILLHWLFSKRR